MKNTNFSKFTTTFLTVCAVIFGLTAVVNAAVKPELISKSSNGAYGNSDSLNFSVSADGRYVVFQSIATNLVSGITDTNNKEDIFLRDTLNGTTRCLSCVPLANPTATGNSASLSPIISPDGRYVVFASFATDLASGADLNNDSDVFRFDTQLNERVLVSVTPSGAFAGNDYSGRTVYGRGYDMSDDGRYITFSSNASDLTGISDTNGKSDVFVRDMETNFTRLISRNVSGSAGNNDSFDPSISANGQIVAFTSVSSDLLAAGIDNNNNLDIFVYNLETGSLKCASMSTRTDTVITGSSASVAPVISKNGNRVAYFTNATDVTNIPIPIGNPFTNIVVYDIGFNQNALVTVNVAGNASGNGESGFGSNAEKGVSISADGRYVTFESKASNLSPLTASTSTYNVFRRDLAQGKTEVVSVNPAGIPGTQNTVVFGTRNRVMSSDGRFVTFSGNSSLAADFPSPGGSQIYVRDMLNGITTALTLNYAGTALGNGISGGSTSPAISANGKAVVFLSKSTDLTPTPTSTDFLNVFKSAVPTPQKAVSDFDGDGKTDFAVWRPSTGTWYVLPNSGNYLASTLTYGGNGDKIVPADYSGDSRTDYAVFRPSNGTWYVIDGSNFNTQNIQFGQSGDVPMPADYDGDGKADIAVFRPSNGVWYILQSSNGQVRGIAFGAGADIPVMGDYDGDGKSDIAVFRPSDGNWYYIQSLNGQYRATHFGQSGDKPAAADFDSDGKTDIAVYRSGVWYIQKSLSGQVASATFGAAADIPVTGDYDGDGKADIAVFRPSDGNWYYIQSSNGQYRATHFGQSGDAPAPGAFVQ